MGSDWELCVLKEFFGRTCYSVTMTTVNNSETNEQHAEGRIEIVWPT